MNKRHLYLNNQIQTITKFTKRGFVPEEDEERENLPDKYETKKAVFRRCYDEYYIDIQKKYSERTLEIPTHIDYVKLDFHVIFNKDLSEEFSNRYGLVPVKYEQFNKTVLLGIEDDDKFQLFLTHISTFYQRQIGDIQLNEESYLLVLLDSFKLLSTQEIIRGFSNENVIVELIDNTRLDESIRAIKEELFTFFTQIEESHDDFKYYIESGHSFIDISNAPNGLLEELAKNFDVIYKIQSHTYKVKPSTVGMRQTVAGFEILPDVNAPQVGVIDTGVQQASVLRNVITNYDYDLTNMGNPLPIVDTNGHGTGIAGLIALGTDFFNTNKSSFTSFANIIPIKALDGENGTYSLIELEKVIRSAAEKGVKLFNVSMTSITNKSYNESVSENAYLFDKLAYELDIIFFISAGNLGHEDMEEIQKNTIPFHEYPNHFFNPNEESLEHVCECCNINSPAESYSNITVGAIAENFNANDSDLTYDKGLPAYYTKKFHLDFSKKINGYIVPKSVINKNIHKPDLVFGGGDAVRNDAGMEVLSTRPGMLSEFSYGTSNATPLVTSIAAQLSKLYPQINTQSIKALLINASRFNYGSGFLNLLINKLKQEYIDSEFEGRELAELTRSEKMQLSKLYSAERLMKYLTGHGVPDINRVLYSNDDSLTMLLENSIRVDSHKGLIIELPSYLNKMSESTRKGVINISATLCYSFEPIFNNSIAYCPLHISFAIFKPLDDDLNKSIDIIKDYTPSEKKNDQEKKRLSDLAKKEREFKNGIKWSEDYFPTENKAYSNCQKLDFNVSSPNIVEKGNKLNLVVRCTCKTNIDQEHLRRLQNRNHKFSIAIRIEELEVDGNKSGSLYNEMVAINTLEAIQDIVLDSSMDLDADLEI